MVEKFIEKHTIPLLVLVIVFLVAFGMYRIKANPSNVDLGGKDPDTALLQSIVIDAHVTRQMNSTRAFWFGAAQNPVGETHTADVLSTKTFTISAGDNAWGEWLLVMGSSDTPMNGGGNALFQGTKVLIIDVTHKRSVTFIQTSVGETGQAGVDAGNYSLLVATPDSDEKNDSHSISGGLVPVGTKVWARMWIPGQSSGDLNFYAAFKEYAMP